MRMCPGIATDVAMLAALSLLALAMVVAWPMPMPMPTAPGAPACRLLAIAAGLG